VASVAGVMVCGLLLGASTTCFASSITYVGSDVDLGSGWRTSTVPKSDIDRNNVLGSDGWYVAGGSGSQMLPAYIASLVSNSSVYPGNGGYVSIDNPLTTPGPSPVDYRIRNAESFPWHWKRNH
jgi:hypothetical protein